MHVCARPRFLSSESDMADLCGLNGLSPVFSSTCSVLLWESFSVGLETSHILFKLYTVLI